MQASSDAVIFVMSNRGYAIEQAFVDLEAFDPHGVFAPFDNLPTWDYLALAQAFGARGVRLTNPTEPLRISSVIVFTGRWTHSGRGCGSKT